MSADRTRGPARRSGVERGDGPAVRRSPRPPVLSRCRAGGSARWRPWPWSWAIERSERIATAETGAFPRRGRIRERPGGAWERCVACLTDRRDAPEATKPNDPRWARAGRAVHRTDVGGAHGGGRARMHIRGRSLDLRINSVRTHQKTLPFAEMLYASHEPRRMDHAKLHSCPTYHRDSKIALACMSAGTRLDSGRGPSEAPAQPSEGHLGSLSPWLVVQGRASEPLRRTPAPGRREGLDHGYLQPPLTVRRERGDASPAGVSARRRAR